MFAPARLVSSLFAADPARGFVIANTLVVLFGVLSYAVSVRHGRRSAVILAWFWAILESLNGIGHMLFALAQQGYFPGVAPAPLLLGPAGYLLRLAGTAQRADTR